MKLRSHMLATLLTALLVGVAVSPGSLVRPCRATSNVLDYKGNTVAVVRFGDGSAEAVMSTLDGNVSLTVTNADRLSDAEIAAKLAHL